MATSHVVNLKIGEDIDVAERVILDFRYRVMWDRGCSAFILISDPNTEIHNALADAQGDPTIPITFRLAYKPQEESSGYPNVGTTHRLYIRKFALVTAPSGPALLIRAVDLASIILKRETLSFHETGKADVFLAGYLQELGLRTEIPETGDVSAPHRAVHGVPLDIVRYELDRVLSASGKPLSLQYDDRADQQKVRIFEELYDDATQQIESYSSGIYDWGIAIPGNNSRGSVWGTVAYAYLMEVDIDEALWGHKVSINQLTSNNSQVTGEVEQRVANRLGFRPSVLNQTHRRLIMPRTHIDSPTPDEYYSRSSMVNRVFQSEMSLTRGFVIIDPDYRAFDDVTVLNRRHLRVSVTGASNDPTEQTLLPNENVIMGWEHFVNFESAATKVYLRRGK